MAFMLKNRGAIYHKCIHIILEPQIGRNVKAYIDGVVVKSKKCEDLLDDLNENFGSLHKYKMMLNPKNVCLVYHQCDRTP
jgi:superoxide dismutase